VQVIHTSKKEPPVKISIVASRIFCVALVLFPLLAIAQEADKQKLIEIEKEFAAHPNAGPELAATYKKYLYDGSLSQVTGMGRIGTLPKARIVELGSKPDPSDPNVKSTQQPSDFHVDIYGQTALVTYKVTSTDTGHKDPALNTTDHYGCMDTYVKRNGNWYAIGNACAPSEPLSQSEWEAVKKARTTEPKDVQEAYH
jgi:hypothetical protein